MTFSWKNGLNVHMYWNITEKLVTQLVTQEHGDKIYPVVKPLSLHFFRCNMAIYKQISCCFQQ